MPQELELLLQKVLFYQDVLHHQPGYGESLFEQTVEDPLEEIAGREHRRGNFRHPVKKLGNYSINSVESTYFSNSVSSFCAGGSAFSTK